MRSKLNDKWKIATIKDLKKNIQYIHVVTHFEQKDYHIETLRTHQYTSESEERYQYYLYCIRRFIENKEIYIKK